MLIIFDLDDTLYDRTGQMPDNHTDKDIESITLFDGVMDFLKKFNGNKVLVSHESIPGLQDRKIDSLGIREYFDKVLLCTSNAGKKICFEEAMQTFPQDDTWVIGDKVFAELKAGNELGCTTVWLRHGMAADKEPLTKIEKPDYEIKTFMEFVELMARIEDKEES